MEGYLVRIPSDAWLGAGNKSPKASTSKRSQPAQLLYYELGEGFLRGYASPEDVEPIDEFQLTSFRVQVDVMPSMRMFQVVATSKTSPRSATSASVLSSGSAKDDSDSSSDDDSDSDSDSSDDDDDGDATKANDRSSSSAHQSDESSILLYAATRELVQTWGSRVLNWNRHVFGGDEADPAALEASKRELLAAFQTHCCASWFSRPLSLDADPTSAVTDKRSAVVDSTSFEPPRPVDVTKPSTEMPAPSKPWWMFTAPQTRRISATSLRKS